MWNALNTVPHLSNYVIPVTLSKVKSISAVGTYFKHYFILYVFLHIIRSK